MILGLLAIVAPFIAGIAVAVATGILVIVAGLAQCYLGLGSKERKATFLGLALGALAILAGIVMLADPLLALVSLTIVLAAYFLVHGAVQIGWLLSRERPRGWGWTLMDAIASIALAAIIWLQWPVSGLWTVGLLAGVKLLFTGAAMIGIGRAARAMTATARRAGPAA
jgi:uncharacterized membrane protein HdeD (DUF308 family)